MKHNQEIHADVSAAAAATATSPRGDDERAAPYEADVVVEEDSTTTSTSFEHGKRMKRGGGGPLVGGDTTSSSSSSGSAAARSKAAAGGGGSVHRFAVLEKQLSTPQQSTPPRLPPSSPPPQDAVAQQPHPHFCATNTTEPLPPTVSGDLIRITRRMANDSDLVARMSTIVMEECPAPLHRSPAPPAEEVLDVPCRSIAAVAVRDDEEEDSLSLSRQQGEGYRRADSASFDVVSNGSQGGSPPAGSASPFYLLGTGSGRSRTHHHHHGGGGARPRRSLSEVSNASSTASASTTNSTRGGHGQHYFPGSQSTLDSFDSQLEREEFEKIFSMDFSRVGGHEDPHPLQQQSGVGQYHFSRQRQSAAVQATESDVPSEAGSVVASISVECDDGGEDVSSNCTGPSTPNHQHHHPASLPPLELSNLASSASSCSSANYDSQSGAVVAKTTAPSTLQRVGQKLGTLVAGERLRRDAIAAGIALASVARLSSQFVTATVQHLWTSCCSMFSVESGTSSSMTSRRSPVTPRSTVGGEQPSTAAVARADNGPREIARLHDQRFYLAAAMLINTSILWALWNRVRPSQVLQPVVELIQTAFFTAVY